MWINTKIWQKEGPDKRLGIKIHLCNSEFGVICITGLIKSSKSFTLFFIWGILCRFWLFILLLFCSNTDSKMLAFKLSWISEYIFICLNIAHKKKCGFEWNFCSEWPYPLVFANFKPLSLCEMWKKQICIIFFLITKNRIRHGIALNGVKSYDSLVDSDILNCFFFFKSDSNII